MSILWIAIADAASAKIFKTTVEFSKLEPVHEFEHAAAHKKESELVTYQQGSARTPAGKHGGFTPHTFVKDTEAEKFARQLGSYLNQSHQKGDFGKLVIVAPPSFLGLLRSALDPSIQIYGTAPKNVTSYSRAELSVWLKQEVFK
jgi:protein required for attachment to host cells